MKTLADTAPYAASHRASLIGGLVAALVVVGARIALPWTLKAALKPFVVQTSGAGASAASWIPASIDPLLVYCISFLILLVLMGYADYRERLSFARFSIGVVHDLRSKAAQSVRRQMLAPSPDGVRQGDAIARLIGDTARVKAGLKGFLVHVATNGAMAAGVSIVLIAVDPALGLVFGLGALITAAVTWRGATAIYGRAARYRAKEGALAETIHSSQSEDLGTDTFTAESSESATHEARITQLQGQTTWAAHAIFGTTVLACLWIGVQGTRTGRLDASHLVVFVLYALMMRAPLVQLARQGVRTGKIFACLERVLEIKLDADRATTGSVDALPPLGSSIQLRDVRVRLGRGVNRRTCLRIESLELIAGQRIAIVGPQGSGKTILLQLLAGAQSAARGRVLWDERTIALAEESHLLSRQTHLVPVLPRWTRRTLRAALALPPGLPDQAALDQLRACGARKLMRRWPAGLDARVSSDELSLGERKQIALARALLAVTGPSVLLMDDLTSGLTKRAARKMLSAVFKHAGERTVLMSFSRAVKLHRFDRVIELRGGRVVLDADPESWQRATEAIKRPLTPAGLGEYSDPTSRSWDERNQESP